MLSSLIAFLSITVAAGVDFERELAPILVNQCIDCHHPGKASGGLDLSTIETMRRGGESGNALTPGKPNESLMWSRIESGEMPPSKLVKESNKLVKESLTDKDREVIRRWIAEGADWPTGRHLGLHEKSIDVDRARMFWSLQTVRRPPVPKCSDSDFGNHPIDAFLAHEWDAHGLRPALLASSQQWLRRAWLDLVGLPPTWEEQERFLRDSSSDNIAETVDRLLAHPGYGERWGRHWLDLVRYADSNGYERDGSKPSVWRYRDYVIDALNSDKPYDRFVLEQIAGDELPDASRETLIATGLHALGTWQDEVDPLEQMQYRADELDDVLRTFSQTFLGLTIGCARCHQHKFDPLTMVDYYSLAAIFSPQKRPNQGRTDRDLPAGSLAELALIESRDKSIAELRCNIEEMRSRGESEASRILIAEYEYAIQKKLESVPDLPRGYFLYEDTNAPPDTYLLLSGRASNPGPKMQPAIPAVLASRQLTFVPRDTRSSGRRLELARWLIDPSNPLVARVIVNRVWQHHFGVGLVSTSSDFGQLGARPSHPELLDWLSHWFAHDADWSLKKLHRLIMTSRAYQLMSAVTEEQLALDPENKLLSRFPNRRLEVEAIRDSILTVSGQINAEMRGPGVYLPIATDVIEAHTDKLASWSTGRAEEVHRRTIYGYVKRTLMVPMLDVLDFCDTTNSTDKRSITSIAPQSLTLFNGEFVNQQAEYFADRLVREVGTDIDQQVRHAYRIGLCRDPTESERKRLKQFVLDNLSSTEFNEIDRRKALIQVCRVLLNLNEFVYVE